MVCAESGNDEALEEEWNALFSDRGMCESGQTSGAVNENVKVNAARPKEER